MNLLLLDQYSNLGGAQQCLLDLLPAFKQRGWRAVLAAPGEGALFERARSAGAIVERLSGGTYSAGRKSIADIVRFARDFPRTVRHIRELIVRYRIDLLYVNGPRLVPAAVWAARTGIPIVFHCHSSVPWPYSTLLVRWPLTRVRAAAISSSSFTGSSLRLKTPLQVIYNGVPDLLPARNRARQVLGKNSASIPLADGRGSASPVNAMTCITEPRASASGLLNSSQFRQQAADTMSCRIGLIGRIAPQKGQLLFVRAARLVADAFPKCSFEICGSPLFSDPDFLRYQEQVQSSARGLPIQFTGWTNDVASILARLDLLVVPSVGVEATTRVILEAFSAEVPVVALATGGIPEVISHGRTGFLVTETTSKALASAILTAISHGPASLRSIATAARKEWEARFTLERYQQDVLGLLDRVRAGFKAPEHGPKDERREDRDECGRSEDHRVAKT